MSKKHFKKAFTRKASEYIDHPDLPKEEREFYEKFIFEYYDNNLSKDITKIKTQLHDTHQLVDRVYAQTNSRNRDLLSKQRATQQLDELDENTTASLYEERDYLYSLKIQGFNHTLKEMFTDYSQQLLNTKHINPILNILKKFYIDVNRLNREERKYRKNEKKIAKGRANETKEK